MGLTLYGPKGQNLDVSTGGFMRLRRRISDLCGEPWASHYRSLTDCGRHDKDDQWFQDFDRATQEHIDNKTVHVKIVDFLLQSDIAGRIRYGACRKILDVIGDYDDDYCYGYAALPNQTRFQDFKNLLRSCVEHKKDLRWS